VLIRYYRKIDYVDVGDPPNVRCSVVDGLSNFILIKRWL